MITIYVKKSTNYYIDNIAFNKYNLKNYTYLIKVANIKYRKI